MAYTDIEASVKAKVATELAGTYSIQYENEEAFVKPDDSVYLRAFTRSIASTTKAFGNGVRYELRKVLEFQIIGVAFKNDEDDVNDAVDAIISAFSYINIMVGDAENSIVRFQNPNPQPQGRINGAYQTNVSVEYWVDLVSN